MDKKKKIILLLLVAFCMLGAGMASAQSVRKVKFCDKKYEYGIGRDSVTIYFNILDGDGRKVKGVTASQLQDYMVFKEDGNIIPPSSGKLLAVSSGTRIPSEYTFSVLVDLSIPSEGKTLIYNAISKLVESAPQGCVYVSFFGDNVTSSVSLTKDNLDMLKQKLQLSSTNKYFYGAMYAKLAEFSAAQQALEQSVITEDTYKRNGEICSRAKANPGKNILFVFTEGNTSPTIEESIAFLEVTEYQQDRNNIVPTVYALYYTEQGQNADIENVLQGVCSPNIEGREGKYIPVRNISQILSEFQLVVNEQMYDYSFSYRATEGKRYMGKTVYVAEWKGDEVGMEEFSVGTVERPWPEMDESASESLLKYIVAILVTVVTIVLLFVVLKIIIPLFQSKRFEMKYYRRYVPESNVSRRKCYFCGQEITAGQSIVARCKHIMHVNCWKDNGYRCSEYGQNCNEGMQQHVDWKEMLSMRSLKDCHQTIAGIFAGFISWLLYELSGRGVFDGISSAIVGKFYRAGDGMPDLTTEAVSMTSAFLTIGLLLGFFLSLIFRYNDEYRSKDWKVMLKIIGLSLLTSLIGLLVFMLGALILCLLLSGLDVTYVPWYCSLPAYLMFSICIPLALTVKSSIPLKSALIGGGIAAVIGFVVLYFSSFAGQMNMLLDFIIYGGGLGASLVTVRMLAERYFLVITNGVKQGHRIPIHKWMSATGGGNKVSIGITNGCEIQMNWEKSNKVAKEHVKLYIDPEKQLPIMKTLAPGVLYNNRTMLLANQTTILSNGDTFKIGDTIFQYVETV